LGGGGDALARKLLVVEVLLILAGLLLGTLADHAPIAKRTKPDRHAAPSLVSQLTRSRTISRGQLGFSTVSDAACAVIHSDQGLACGPNLVESIVDRHNFINGRSVSVVFSTGQSTSIHLDRLREEVAALSSGPNYGLMIFLAVLAIAVAIWRYKLPVPDAAA
jgi:hypothetical protein